MGFGFVGDDPIFVEDDAAGVVGENADAEVFGTFLLANFIGGAFDKGFVEAVLDFVDWVGEDGVFAMFGPSLGDRFEFDVVWWAFFDFVEVGFDCFEIGFVEGEWAAAGAVFVGDALLADFEEFFFGDIEVDLVGVRVCLEGDFGDDCGHADALVFGEWDDGDALDEVVGEGFADFVGLLCGDLAFDEDQLGGVEAFVGIGEFGFEEVFDAFFRGGGDIVGDAWKKADF